MQVGSFYEIYAILNDTEQRGEVNIYHICQNLMNIAVAKMAEDFGVPPENVRFDDFGI